MDDLRSHKHGDEGEGSTHYTCNEMLKIKGAKAVCCGCVKHTCKSQEEDMKTAKILQEIHEEIFESPQECRCGRPDLHFKFVNGECPIPRSSRPRKILS